MDPARPGTGLEITAWTDDTPPLDLEVMAVRHTRHPVWGVQFHPEALRTDGGHRLLANFLTLGRGEPASDIADLSLRTSELDRHLRPPTAHDGG